MYKEVSSYMQMVYYEITIKKITRVDMSTLIVCVNHCSLMESQKIICIAYFIIQVHNFLSVKTLSLGWYFQSLSLPFH